ncbi:hypothetical protein CesoFtcFv8_027519 [Champsocephalus esox]|uniref:Uncharacterized protein n=1 Tax=Champsocephalus esox TaxID=159716 RepID=A0AAN7Y386_9TELE|nr:hypothetical protein CesoFtcFv8_027519 [Champsocephalus esox]
MRWTQLHEGLLILFSVSHISGDSPTQDMNRASLPGIVSMFELFVVFCLRAEHLCDAPPAMADQRSSKHGEEKEAKERHGAVSGDGSQPLGLWVMRLSWESAGAIASLVMSQWQDEQAL